MLTTLGGIGCFLLAMSLLVEGLKALAGGALRRVLTSAVRGPVSGFITGVSVTALLQSSSATTVATIGFVSAGLLTFTQSIGVVLGANVGTTSTSWLVATLGLRLSISAVSLPILAAGALLRLLGRGRLSDAGTALAGFGLLFLGIGLLEEGMASLVAGTAVDSLPLASSLEGRALLVGGGFVMTVILQSSSAAIATTMVALASGGLGFEQSAAIVIGANVGTTVTAVFAAFGSSVSAYRTAIVHVLFNVTVAVAAFALLPQLATISVRAGEWLVPSSLPVSLAVFHTMVKLAGSAVFLPLTVPLAGLLVRVLPEREDDLTRHLDRTVVTVGPVANEALRRTIAMAFSDVARVLSSCLREHRAIGKPLDRVRGALPKASAFAAQVGQHEQSVKESIEHARSLHALDHLVRMLGVLRGDELVRTMSYERGLEPQRQALLAVIDRVAAWEDPNAIKDDVEVLAAHSAAIASLRKKYRVAVLNEAAKGVIDPDLALVRLDASRALDQIGYQCWRAANHLGGTDLPRGAVELEGPGPP